MEDEGDKKKVKKDKKDGTKKKKRDLNAAQTSSEGLPPRLPPLVSLREDPSFDGELPATITVSGTSPGPEKKKISSSSRSKSLKLQKLPPKKPDASSRPMGAITVRTPELSPRVGCTPPRRSASPSPGRTTHFGSGEEKAVKIKEKKEKKKSDEVKQETEGDENKEEKKEEKKEEQEELSEEQLEEKQKKRNRMRHSAALEVLTSEETYLSSLLLVREMYLKPFEEGCEESGSKLLMSRFFSPSFASQNTKKRS
jgi:hypothetical protein